MTNQAHWHSVQSTAVQRLLRVIRAFAEGALVAVGFAVVIWLIGMPIALSVQGTHALLSWVIGGELAGPGEALVYVASAVGGIVFVAVFVRALVALVRSRRRRFDHRAGRGTRSAMVRATDIIGDAA